MLKNFFLLTVFCFFSFISFSQNEKKDTTDATPKISALAFAGLVGAPLVDVTNPRSVNKFANLRVGGDFTYRINKSFSFRGILSADPIQELVLFQSTVRFQQGKFAAQAGFGPTPATLLRPVILSVDGQFEFAAESQPPGGALGGYIQYADFRLGSFFRDSLEEHHFAWSRKSFSIALWGNSAEPLRGGTFKIELDQFYTMVTATRELQSIALVVQPFKKVPLKLLSNFSVSIKDKKIINNMVGIGYNADTRLFKALRFGIVYDIPRHLLGPYFLFGLQKEK